VTLQRELAYRLRSLVGKDQLDRESNEESLYRLERKAKKTGNKSDEVEDAGRAARSAFGPLESVKEECREARGTAFIESILADRRWGGGSRSETASTRSRRWKW
jgi:hypothetical protein